MHDCRDMSFFPMKKKPALAGKKMADNPSIQRLRGSGEEVYGTVIRKVGWKRRGSGLADLTQVMVLWRDPRQIGGLVVDGTCGGSVCFKQVK